MNILSKYISFKTPLFGETRNKESCVNSDSFKLDFDFWCAPTSVVKLTKPNFPWNTRRNWATKTNSHIECILFVGKAPRKLKRTKLQFVFNVCRKVRHKPGITTCDKLKFEFTRWQDAISHNRAQSRERAEKKQTTQVQSRQISEGKNLPCLWRPRILKRRLTFVKSRKFSC